MLSAVADPTSHDFSMSVFRIAFPTETFSGGALVAAFPFGLQEGHRWFRDPESSATSVWLLLEGCSPAE